MSTSKDLGNLLYHSAVIGGLSIGCTMIGKKLFKMKPADLGRLDLEDSTKLAGTVALSLWTQDMLVKRDHSCEHHQDYIVTRLSRCYRTMAAIGMMIGGADVNALAFTGGNYLFSMLGRSDEAERNESGTIW